MERRIFDPRAGLWLLVAANIIAFRPHTLWLELALVGLLLLLMAVRRVTGFEPGREAMKTLSTIITYAMCVNVFFYLLEIFTAFYSGIPGHQHSILYLFTGHDLSLIHI